MDYTVHGILQARILKWVALPFATGSSQPRDRTQDSHLAGGLYQLSHEGSPSKHLTKTEQMVVLLGSSVVENLPANARHRGDTGLIPGSGRPPAEGHVRPLQYPCLEDSKDTGDWRATDHGVAKSRTRLSE